MKAANVESLPDENILVGSAAVMLVMLLDGVGMMAWGDYGKLTTTEKTMIEEPLKRILKNVAPKQLDAIGKYADPLLLMMGLMAWITRVTNESKRRKEVKPISNEPKPEVVKPTPPEKVDTMETFPPNEIISVFDANGVVL